TTFNRGIITALAVILNIILIPRLSYFGAGLTFFITNFILLFLDLYWVKKIMPLNYSFFIKIAAKTLLATLLMMLVILSVKSYFHLLIAMPFGVIIYFIGLFVLRGLSLEEVRDLARKGFK
ncbi:polysaccharide biosynthesis C-terminal domain-containing protein, partial [Candidatus Falkowbacteria bacterium]|nr:polysaccharide biosynthesis C-terminal domain-containing protein [Candidatus Falkowbacteria bacterium]